MQEATTRRRLSVLTAGALLLAAGALPLAGCEEEVLMATRTERPFTLYGTLTPEADTQWVRVYAIQERLEPIRPVPLGARFTTTEATSGTVRVWSDSLLRERDGSWAHVFWAPFRAGYGERFLLEVAAPDGRESRVDVAVPPRTELVLPGPEAYSPRRYPIRLRGGAPRLLNVVLEYEVKFADGPPEETHLRIPISYEEAPLPTEEGWILPVHLARDYATVRDLLRTTTRQGRPLYDAQYGVRVIGMTLSLEVVNAEWVRPAGGFDPERLVEPGALSNVQNGFGFVGAGYHVQKRWTPPAALLEEAGFRPPSAD